MPAGWCYGASDVPIDDAHLDALAAALPAVLPRGARLWSSPLSRCLRLARALEPRLGEARVDARLREMDFGRWEGRPWTEVPREQLDAWRDDLEHYAPPGGESLAAPAGTDAVAVTHAGVILTLARIVRGLPLSEFGGLRVDYGQVVTLVDGPAGWSVEA